MISHRSSLKQVAVIGFLAWVAFTPTAIAAQPRDPIQREDLALINTQLTRVDQIIDRLAARQAADPNPRVALDVTRLRADVDKIRAGIQSYLSPPRLAPRHLSPLSGQYASSERKARP